MALTKSVLELKGEMLMLNVLRLQDINIDKIEAALQKKRDEAPLFFIQSPIVVDCSHLDGRGALLDLRSLRRILVKMDFVPVGLRDIEDSMRAAALAAGWNVLRSPARKAIKDKTVSQEAVIADSNSKKQLVAEDKTGSEIKDRNADKKSKLERIATKKTSMMIERPIRSGQQVYAEGGDLIVLSQTSAGSEVMADGSIHVYGALRGRVLAGVKGDKTARIFCRSLEAELIVIAGCYQLLDESDTDLKGKPAMIHLEHDKLIIEPLV